MCVPNSEAGYTSATTGRGDHEVHKGYVVALAQKTIMFTFGFKFRTVKKNIWEEGERKYTVLIKCEV
jgi:hypothetical protein